MQMNAAAACSMIGKFVGGEREACVCCLLFPDMLRLPDKMTDEDSGSSTLVSFPPRCYFFRLEQVVEINAVVCSG